MTFRKRGSFTVVEDLYQQGCYKVRFPGRQPQANAEAVLINTSGGLTDGDELVSSVDLHDETAAMVTTQAAERIYRSRRTPANLHTELNIGEHAAACWLPQETILFDGARLKRHIDINMALHSSLFACEMVVLGRAAMGETLQTGRLFDRWRIRRDGALIFADAISFDGEGNTVASRHLVSRAMLNNSIAMATVVCVGGQMAALVDPMRKILEGGDVVGGVSMPGPCVVARLLAPDSRALRAAVVRLFHAVQQATVIARSGSAFALPRVWAC